MYLFTVSFSSAIYPIQVQCYSIVPLCSQFGTSYELVDECYFSCEVSGVEIDSVH